MFGLSSKKKWVDLTADVDVVFDSMPGKGFLLKGERIIDTLEDVEDVKGQTFATGPLTLTNLRIRWSCTGSPAMNVNIGLGMVTSMSTRTATSRVRGDTGAIVIATKDPEQPLQRLEFIFGCKGSVAASAGAQSQAANPAGSPTSASAGIPDGLASGTPGARWVATTFAVLKGYETTRLYRDLRLRGALVSNKQAILLPRERLVGQGEHHGVMNLSSDQGHLGVLTITDKRVIWHATITENFNVSVPYGVLEDVRVQNSARFGGRLLVLETSPRGNSYLLGFRVDTPEKLEQLCKEITAVRAAALHSPDYGVEVSSSASGDSGLVGGGHMGAAAAKETFTEGEGVEESDDRGGMGVHASVLGREDPFAAYYAGLSRSSAAGDAMGAMGGSAGDAGGTEGLGRAARGEARPPVYMATLGLAVEELPEGLTLEALWTAV